MDLLTRFKYRSILSKAHFNYVFKNASRIRGKLCYIYVAKCDADLPSYAVITSKKVGNAVQRNRCRRQVKSFFSLFYPHFSKTQDMIVVVHSDMVGVSSDVIYRTIESQLDQNGLWYAADT